MKIRGLLLKDIYELWTQSRLLLALIAVYLLVPVLTGSGTMLGSVGLLLLAMLPASAIGCDERSKWERYALTMPVTKRQLHAEKFLLGFLALTLGAALQLTLALALRRTELLPTILPAYVGGLVYLAAMLPLLFKLGLEKGRMLFLLLTVGLIVLLGFAGDFLAP